MPIILRVSLTPKFLIVLPVGVWYLTCLGVAWWLLLSLLCSYCERAAVIPLLDSSNSLLLVRSSCWGGAVLASWLLVG